MRHDFLKEWDDAQTKEVKKAICKYFKNRQILTDKDGFLSYICNFRSYKDMDLFFGLAYTSTSQYAGLWICNLSLYLDVDKIYTISGFVMDNAGGVYLLCSGEGWDVTEIYIRIN